MERARLVLAGRWDVAGLGDILTEPGDRREIARRARIDFDGHPRHRPFAFARYLGIEPMIAPVRGCGGELATPTAIYIRWGCDPVARAERVLHGIAHVLLQREAWRHTEADAWLLTADLMAE